MLFRNDTPCTLALVSHIGCYCNCFTANVALPHYGYLSFSFNTKLCARRSITLLRHIATVKGMQDC